MAIENHDREEFIEKSIGLLEERKEEYEKIKNTCIDLLYAKISSQISGLRIEGRLKDADKLREKIYRKNYYNKYLTANDFVDDLPDGIGIRIICLMKEEEKVVYDLLKSAFSEEEIINQKQFSKCDEGQLYICFLNQPETQKNSLEIYRMDAVYNSEKQKIRLEIQIKCLTHFFWGEIEHALFYKNYAYTLGNDFYAGLMKSINSELENIDSEMGMLRRHMSHTTENQVDEIRQIAALMISKKYDSQIENALKCKIDLREVYAVLVDTFFGLISDTQTAVDMLNELMSKLKRNVNIIDFEKKKAEIDKNQLDSTAIAANNKGLVDILDKNIKSGDVFWEYLFIIYSDIFPDKRDNYSSILNKLAEKIQYLYPDVIEAADALNMDYEGWQQAVIQVFNRIIGRLGKMGYYSLDYGMRSIKERMEEAIKDIQNKIYAYHSDGMIDVKLLNDNIKTIQNVIYIATLSGIRQPISREEWPEILRCLSETNDYQLGISDENKKFILSTDQLDYEQTIKLESTLMEGRDV